MVKMIQYSLKLGSKQPFLTIRRVFTQNKAMVLHQVVKTACPQLNLQKQRSAIHFKT